MPQQGTTQEQEPDRQKNEAIARKIEEWRREDGYFKYIGSFFIGFSLGATIGPFVLCCFCFCLGQDVSPPSRSCLFVSGFLCGFLLIIIVYAIIGFI